MSKVIELRRHAPNEGDALTPEGVRAAVAIGATLAGPYAVAVSSGAQRATQTVACLLAGLGQPVARGVIVEPGLRSAVEDRWFAAYDKAGDARLSALREADPELVGSEAPLLAQSLSRILDILTEGQQALVVAHAVTSEAAVFGLTGVEIPALGHCAGARVTMSDPGRFEVQPLEGIGK